MLDQKLRIALVSSQIAWGGGEQFVWSLGQKLLQRGHEVLWFADPKSALFQRITQAAYEVQAFPARKPSLGDLKRFRDACNRRSINIVHSNDTHALNWSSLALLGSSNIKRVAVKHTNFPVRSAFKYNWLVDALACVSEAVRKRCVDAGVTRSKTNVIHGGVEYAPIECEQARSEIRKMLDVSESTPVFTAVGNLLPCKAYHRMVLAADKLRARLADFRIVICGEGSERASLESQINELGLTSHVKLVGFQKDPTPWIAASDAFVHPSLNEGLSLVAIQAQMLGIPLVATRCGGLDEVMTHPLSGKELGWTISGDDADGLAETLLKLTESSEEVLRFRADRVRLAKESALERFHVDRMVDNFEHLYRRLSVATCGCHCKTAQSWVT